MITLTNLEKIYRTKEIETVALENVNLTVNKGEFLSIMGPSGCGKSTLLNIIGLLDAPTSGTVEIAGINTINMNDKQLAEFRNQKLGFVFQSFHLINSLNVLDNVELPLLYRKVSAKERREAAVAVLERSASRTACATSRRSSPAASASVSPSPVPSSAIPTSSLPTSRPVTWTPRWEPKSWNCSTN